MDEDSLSENFSPNNSFVSVCVYVCINTKAIFSLGMLISGN